jgi:hypothetical protein
MADPAGLVTTLVQVGLLKHAYQIAGLSGRSANESILVLCGLRREPARRIAFLTLKWVAPLIRRGFVSEACKVDGAGGVEGFGCAHR